MKYVEKDPRFVDFGERIRNARGEMSQEELAEKAELSVASVQRAEAGCTISRITIEKLEKTLLIAFNPQICSGIRNCPYAHQCVKEITDYLTLLPNSKEVK